MSNYGYIPQLRFKGFDDNNAPLAGGKLYSYVAGTNTPLPLYVNKTGSPASNPVILNARGEAQVYMSDTSAYKLVLKDSNDVTIWTEDNVTTGGSSGSISGLDEKVKISGVDELAGFLNSKILAGDGIVFDINIGGVAGDSITINSEGKSKVSSSGAYQYLQDAITSANSWITISNVGDKVVINATPLVNEFGKVKLDALDTLGYITDKLIAGTGIEFVRVDDTFVINCEAVSLINAINDTATIDLDTTGGTLTANVVDGSIDLSKVNQTSLNTAYLPKSFSSPQILNWSGVSQFTFTGAGNFVATDLAGSKSIMLLPNTQQIRFNNNLLDASASGTYTWAMPASSGTVALTSDIPSLSNYVLKTGDTMSGALTISNNTGGAMLYLNAGTATGAQIRFKGNLNTAGFVTGTSSTSGNFVVYNNDTATTMLNLDKSTNNAVFSNRVTSAGLTSTSDLSIATTSVFNGNNTHQHASNIRSTYTINSVQTGQLQASPDNFYIQAMGSTSYLSFWTNSVQRGSVHPTTGQWTFNTQANFQNGIFASSSFTTGQPNFLVNTNSSSDSLSLKFTEEAIGAIPADVWQFRLGGAASRPIVFTQADNSEWLRIDAAGVYSNAFIKSGGTASQFLKADGSVDSNTYATTTQLGNYLPLAGGTLTGALIGTTAQFTSALGVLASYLNINNSDPTSAVREMQIFSRGNASGAYYGWNTKGNGSGATTDLILRYAGADVLTFTGNATTFSQSITANGFVKSGGLSTQFLKADGSVDSNSYALNSALGNYLPLAGGTLTGALNGTSATFNAGLSITGNNADSSAIRIPDNTWIRPQTAGQSIYLTNGTNPTTSNATLHLNGAGDVLLNSGTGTAQASYITLSNGNVDISAQANGTGRLDYLMLGQNNITLYTDVGYGFTAATSATAMTHSGGGNISLLANGDNIYNSTIGKHLWDGGVGGSTAKYQFNGTAHLTGALTGTSATFTGSSGILSNYLHLNNSDPSATVQEHQIYTRGNASGAYYSWNTQGNGAGAVTDLILRYAGAAVVQYTGDTATHTGRVVTSASTTTRAGLNLPPGTAPTSPVNGDIWATTTAVQTRVNGNTRTFGLLGIANDWSSVQTARGWAVTRQAFTPTGTTQAVTLTSGNLIELILTSSTGNVTVTTSSASAGAESILQVTGHASAARNVLITQASTVIQYNGVVSAAGATVDLGTTPAGGKSTYRLIWITATYVVVHRVSDNLGAGFITNSGHNSITTPWSVGDNANFSSATVGLQFDAIGTYQAELKGNSLITVGTNNALSLYRPTSALDTPVCLDLQLQASNGSQQNYGRICAIAKNNVIGSLEGELNFNMMVGGALSGTPRISMRKSGIRVERTLTGVPATIVSIKSGMTLQGATSGTVSSAVTTDGVCAYIEAFGGTGGTFAAGGSNVTFTAGETMLSFTLPDAYDFDPYYLNRTQATLGGTKLEFEIARSGSGPFTYTVRTNTAFTVTAGNAVCQHQAPWRGSFPRGSTI